MRLLTSIPLEKLYHRASWIAIAVVLSFPAAFFKPAKAFDSTAAGVAVFKPRIAASASVISPGHDSRVHLQRDLGFRERASLVTYHGGMRLGEHDWVEFEAFHLDQSGSVTASRTRRIGSIDFLVLFDLETRVSLTGMGATWAHTVLTTGGHEFGGRLGFHLVSLDVSASSVDLERSSSGHGLAAFPHAGLFVRRGAPKGWAWSARADVSDIKFKRFDNRALALAVGLEHRFANGIAIGAEYRYWDVRFGETRGATRREYSGRLSGPAVYLMLTL